MLKLNYKILLFFYSFQAAKNSTYSDHIYNFSGFGDNCLVWHDISH